jgi:hypothetical protein
MLLTAILPWKREVRGLGRKGEAPAMKSLGRKGNTIPYEMDIHVPCHVVGITRDGSRWEGEATTLSISSFGAHVLLPIDAELEGDIALTFKVPPPLASLFPKERFKAHAEVKPSGAAGPGMSTQGRKVVCVVFAELRDFNLRAVKSRA